MSSLQYLANDEGQASRHKSAGSHLPLTTLGHQFSLYLLELEELSSFNDYI